MNEKKLKSSIIVDMVHQCYDFLKPRWGFNRTEDEASIMKILEWMVEFSCTHCSEEELTRKTGVLQWELQSRGISLSPEEAREIAKAMT